jgi:hypothetical protein
MATLGVLHLMIYVLCTTCISIEFTHAYTGALHLVIVMCSAQNCINIEFTHAYTGAMHLVIVMCSAQNCVSIEFTHAYTGCSAPHYCCVLCTTLLDKH